MILEGGRGIVGLLFRRFGFGVCDLFVRFCVGFNLEKFVWLFRFRLEFTRISGSSEVRLGERME